MLAGRSSVAIRASVGMLLSAAPLHGAEDGTVEDDGSGAWLPGRDRRLERREAAVEENPELSLRLENPLARILVLPVDTGFQKGGAADRWAMRFSPRVPFVICEDWHLISRSEWSVVHSGGQGGQADGDGLSDITQSFFFSPDRAVVEQLYWGAGLSMVIPTATDDTLASDKFSLGPTLGVFRQREPWTLGMVATHLWSVAGSGSARNLSTTRLEPVIAYTSSFGTSVSLSAELNYDWLRDDWQVPLEGAVTQLTQLGGRPLQFGVGARYWLDREAGQPDWSVFLRIALPLRSPRWGE